MKVDGARIGIGIGSDAVTAVIRTGRVWQVATAAVELPGNGEDRLAILRGAFDSVARRLTSAAGVSLEGLEAYIAILPPLSDTRLITLPPLRQAEAEVVVRRDAGRHFLGINGARVVAVKASRSAATPSLAAAASAALVEAARSAAVAQGWKLGAIVPAAEAWIAGSRGQRSSDRSIVAVDGETAYVIVIDGGTPTVTRRVPAASTKEVIEACEGAATQVAILASGERRDELTRAFTAAGWATLPGSLDLVTAPAVAAAFASEADLEFVPPLLAAQRQQHAKVGATRMLAAAGVLLVASAVAVLWGAKREVDNLEARRAAISDQVAPLRALQDSLIRLSDEVGLAASLEKLPPVATRALVEVSALLPNDTHLTSLQIVGNLLTMEAAGGPAGKAIEALSRGTALEDVRLVGMVQRDINEGVTTERFRLAGHLRAVSDSALALLIGRLQGEVRDGLARQNPGVPLQFNSGFKMESARGVTWSRSTEKIPDSVAKILRQKVIEGQRVIEGKQAVEEGIEIAPPPPDSGGKIR